MGQELVELGIVRREIAPVLGKKVAGFGVVRREIAPVFGRSNSWIRSGQAINGSSVGMENNLY